MASGDTLLVWTAQAYEPPSASYGRMDIRNQHPVIDLATGEEVRFSGVMPQHYSDTTGVTIYLHYAMSTATANDIELQTAFERIGDQQQDLDTDGFTTAQASAETTVPGTSGLVDIISVAHTKGAQMDSVVKGEGFRLNVERVTVSGTDASGDLELLFVEIRET